MCTVTSTDDMQYNVTVSEWLLFNVNWKISRLYPDQKEQVTFRWKDDAIWFALIQNAGLDFNSARSLKKQFTWNMTMFNLQSCYVSHFGYYKFIFNIDLQSSTFSWLRAN
jgi:hypothetical protein